MFVPDGAKPLDTKEKALVDQADEWLIRVMCFSLGLNPMPFLKMMNKGQEKTHHDEAAQEGLGPWNKWAADFFNLIIWLKFGRRDIQFRWEEEEATDPQEQAAIDKILVDSKIYHPDEIRAKRGDDAMPADLREQMDMATFNAAPNSTVLSPDQQAAKDEQAVALAAAKPAPVMPQSTPAQKADDDDKFQKLLLALKPEAAKINVEGPVINLPAVTVSAAPVTVNLPEIRLPEIRQPDVFVDIGETNIQARFEAPRGGVSKKVTATRTADGGLVGTIADVKLED
jgi:hypothetical protein